MITPDPTTPYALSIRQPWAWAILRFGKDVENRTWDGITRHRGLIIIHAPLCRERDLDGQWWLDRTGQLPPTELPLGAFVGTVQLVGAHRAVSCYLRPGGCSPWAIAEPGYQHLELADPRPFAEPIPGKGRLGFWRPRVDLPIGVVT